MPGAKISGSRTAAPAWTKDPKRARRTRWFFTKEKAA
jgi:hypothetical protein